MSNLSAAPAAQPLECKVLLCELAATCFCSTCNAVFCKDHSEAVHQRADYDTHTVKAVPVKGNAAFEEAWEALKNDKPVHQGLVKACHDGRSCLLTGTGITIYLTGDTTLTWDGLLNRMTKELETYFGGADKVTALSPVFQEVMDQHMDVKGRMLKHMIDMFKLEVNDHNLDYTHLVYTIFNSLRINLDVTDRGAHQTKLIDTIQKFTGPILTVNYDCLLEQALGSVLHTTQSCT